MDADVALVARLAADLDGGFPTLVDAHAARLYTIAHRSLGVAGDAEEVAQDALVRAYRALATYDPARIRALRLGPWLATITINLARNRRRRIADRRPATRLGPILEAGFEPRASEASGPVEIVQRREARRQLAEALLTLPSPMRDAIILRHIDGMSMSDIAAALGRPEGTVKAQIHRGLGRLRDHLTTQSPAVQHSAKEKTA